MSMDGTLGNAAEPGADTTAAPVASSPELVVADLAPPSEPAPAPLEAPAADAPAADAPVGEEAATAEPGSLVESAPEAKPVGDVGAEAAAEIVAEPVTYETFAYPEGVTVNDAELAPFTEALGKHGATQEFGQELIDLHTAQMQNYANHLQQHQIDAFAETRAGWRKEFEAGAGNQRDTILGDAKSAINAAVSSDADRKALWDVLSFTGAGDNPTVIKAFAALGAKLRERGAPPASLPTNPARTGRPEDRRYGASTQR